MITEGALEWEGVVGVNRAAGPKKNRVLELFARVKSPFSRLRRAKKYMWILELLTRVK